MDRQTEQQLKASQARLLKDRLARVGVTTGGVLVLVALLLIFFYLLYCIGKNYIITFIRKINGNEDRIWKD